LPFPRASACFFILKAKARSNAEARAKKRPIKQFARLTTPLPIMLICAIVPKISRLRSLRPIPLWGAIQSAYAAYWRPALAVPHPSG